MKRLYLTIIAIFSLTILLSGCGGKSEVDYKKEAKAVKYEEVARNPDSFKGKPLFLTGRVDEIAEKDGKVEFWLSLEGSKYAWVSYTAKSNEERFLKQDTLRVWGDFQKVSNRKAVEILPGENTIDIDAKYITRPVWSSLSPFIGLYLNIKKDGKDIRFQLSRRNATENGVEIKGHLEGPGITASDSGYSFTGIINDDGTGKIQYEDNPDVAATIKMDGEKIVIDTPEVERTKVRPYAKPKPGNLQGGQYIFPLKK